MDPNIHAEVTAKDDAGNIARGYDDKPVLVDTVADAGITIDSALSWQGMALPAGNRPEFVTVTGHVTPDAKFNDLVTVDVGNNKHLKPNVITLLMGSWAIRWIFFFRTGITTAISSCPSPPMMIMAIRRQQ